MEFKKEEVVVIALAAVLFLGFIFFIRPSTTGYAIHNIESSSYVYNSSLVNISDNEVKLIPTITTTETATITENIVQLNSASQNGHDRLTKVNSLNIESVKIKESDIKEVLNLGFMENLENNDTISVYFTHNRNTEVRLCEPSNLCPEPYSNLNYNGEPKYLNFTLSLNGARNTFGIFPATDKIRIDHVYATHFTTEIKTNTTTAYPFSGEIQTNDIEPENISKFDYIYYAHILNNQNIEYYYSTDSGNTWTETINQNISFLNLTKIKIKAVLYSDETTTPIINSLSLFYSEIQAQTQDNQSNSTQTQKNFIREIETENNIAYLKIYSDTNLSDAVIIINHSDLTQSDKNKLKVIEINSNISFNSAILRINYTDAEIGNLNESSLKLFYYNEGLNLWEEISAVINLNENYIEANLTHFSVYGIFGDLNTEPSNSETNTGGSSGSSSSSSSSGGNRAPSSTAPKETAQDIPIKEESKEITLFGDSKEELKEKLNLPTTQAVREVGKTSYLRAYLFVLLVGIAYLIYYKHTKKPNSGKKLKNKKA